MKVSFELTEREEQMLRALEKNIGMSSPMRMAAEKLHITDGAIKAALYRMRRRYHLANQFSTKYRLWRKKLGGKYL